MDAAGKGVEKRSRIWLGHLAGYFLLCHYKIHSLFQIKLGNMKHVRHMLLCVIQINTSTFQSYNTLISRRFFLIFSVPNLRY